MIEDIYRKFWSSIDDFNRKRIKKLNKKTPKHLNEILDVKYGNDEENTFDMYYAKSLEDKKLPTIVHIHGGAYLGGVKNMYAEYCRILADSGYCSINMEYVNGEKIGFPNPVYDFFALFEFLKKNEKFAKHIDFDNFIISGDSSGGHVASLVANIQTNDQLKEKFKLVGGPEIKGCILTCPTMGVYKFGGMWPKERFEKLVFKQYQNTILKDYCHNLETMTPNFPPTIIISVSVDFIKIHAYMFMDLAKKLNLSLEHYCIMTGKHLVHCTSLMYPYDYENKLAITLIKKFIEKVINGKTKKIVKYRKISRRTKLENLIDSDTVSQ